MRLRSVEDDPSSDSCKYHRYAIEPKSDRKVDVVRYPPCEKKISRSVYGGSHQFVPMGGVDSSDTSLMAMVLGDDETAIKGACSSVDKVVCDSKVVGGESPDILTIQSAMSKCLC